MENQNNKYDLDIIKQWVEYNEKHGYDFKAANKEIENKGAERLKELTETGKTTWTLPETANYVQQVPDSHRYTLYGLKFHLTLLRDQISVMGTDKQCRQIVNEHINELLIGIENAVKAGEELTKLI